MFTAAFVLLPPTAGAAGFGIEMIRQLTYGFTIPLLWAMMADVADFSEWKNHHRATAVVFSAIVFALKAGLGFGGAIGGWLLAAYGYVPNVAQTERALQGIKLTTSIFPAITFALGVGVPVLLPHRQASGGPDHGRAGRTPADVCTGCRGARAGARVVTRYGFDDRPLPRAA